MIRPASSRQGSPSAEEAERENLLSDNNNMASANVYRPPGAGPPTNRNVFQGNDDSAFDEEERKGHPPSIFVKNRNSDLSTGPVDEEGLIRSSARWGKKYCFPNSRSPSIYDEEEDENRAQRNFFAPSGGVHYSYVIVMALFFSTIVQLSRGGLLAYDQKKATGDIHPHYIQAHAHEHGEGREQIHTPHGFNNIRGSNLQPSYYGNWGTGKNSNSGNDGAQGLNSNNMNPSIGNGYNNNFGQNNNGNPMNANSNFPQNNNNMMNGGNGMLGQQQPQAMQNPYSMGTNNQNIQPQYQQSQFQPSQQQGYNIGNGNTPNALGGQSGTWNNPIATNPSLVQGQPTGAYGSLSDPSLVPLQQQQIAAQQGVSNPVDFTQNVLQQQSATAAFTADPNAVQGGALTSDSSVAVAQPVATSVATPVAPAAPAAPIAPETSAVAPATPVEAAATTTVSTSSSAPATDIAPVDSAVSSAIDQSDSLWELANFKDSWDPWEPTDMPVFFHIPKSGGSTIKDVMGTCHRFVMASEAGVTDGHINDKEVAIVYPKVGVPGASLSPFVNIDATTVEGIQRAKDMGFADSHLGDTVVTPFIYEANELFTPTAKGRLFTVFRHPIDRAISLFYYLQVADWEPTYDPALKDWTIEQYATSDKIENNWLTRQLSNQLSGDLEEVHVQKAMEVIRRKFLVGLMTEMEKTMTRLERYFRWTYHVNPENQEKCREKLLSGGSNSNSKNKKAKPKEGDEAWNLLAAQNQHDLQVWGYIEALFNEQEEYVRDIPADIRNVGATCCKCSPPTLPPEGFECPAAITED